MDISGYDDWHGRGGARVRFNRGIFFPDANKAC